MSGETSPLDQLGPEQVRSGVRLVERGRVYDLGLVLGADVPQGVEGEFQPYQPYTSRRTCLRGAAVAVGQYQYSAEAVTCTPHIGTHIDGLAHVASGRTMRGGESADELLTSSGYRGCGMETVPPIVTRAVLLDVAGRRGDLLPDGYELTVDDLRGDDVTVQPGEASGRRCWLTRPGSPRPIRPKLRHRLADVAARRGITVNANGSRFFGAPPVRAWTRDRMPYGGDPAPPSAIKVCRLPKGKLATSSRRQGADGQKTTSLVEQGVEGDVSGRPEEGVPCWRRPLGGTLTSG